MNSKTIILIAIIYAAPYISAGASTITLPGSYDPSSSDAIILDHFSPQRTITYNLGILAGNRIDFKARYININALGGPFGDTVGSGGFRLYHHNNMLLDISNITSGIFAETTLAADDLVENGILRIRLALSEDSDPIELYRPWLFITDDVSPAPVNDIEVTQSYRTGLKLEWSAPGDDGLSGEASLYEIRYSKWPIAGDTSEWWGYAEQAPDVSYPSAPGSHESFVVHGLDTVSTYYFLLVSYDEIGNRSAFSNVASGTTGQDGGPGLNYCLEFNGINTRAVIPNTEILNPTQEITVEAWVLCHELHRWTQGFILGKSWPEYVYPFLQYSLAVDNSDRMYAWFTTADGRGHKLDLGIIPLHENEWMHLSWTYDGATFNTYVNGNLNQSAAVSGQIIVWPHNIYIGILQYLNGWGFDGLIDEIRIWDIARTQEQIQETMGHRLQGDESGLIGYWNFDEGDGQQFMDITRYSSNGFLGSEPEIDNDDPVWVESDCPVDEFRTDTEFEAESQLPGQIELHQNHPNPFNSETRIGFDLPEDTHVRLEIYDMLGRRIITLADGPVKAGFHSFLWDGRSDSGELLSSGIYFYRFKAGGYDQTKKMLMLK